MNKYNPNIHHRKSIRLKGYDYAQAGLYFVTICTQNRECLFGDIIDGELKLNDAGKMIEKWYYELENKFPDIKCGTHIVMPNHFHCIIHNVGADLRVCPNDNADLRVCPNTNEQSSTILGEQSLKNNDREQSLKNNDREQSLENDIIGQSHRIAPTILGEHNPILGEHIGSPLHRVVQWFKTMTTNEYIRNVKNNNWQRFDGKLWQRNYWEHIIRNGKSHQNISEYIVNNPMKWNEDKLNPELNS